MDPRVLLDPSPVPVIFAGMPASPNSSAKWRCVLDDPWLEIDLSDSGLSDSDLEARNAGFSAAFEAMAALEDGALANMDEERMVGHYWLRAPALAPSDHISEEILATMESIRDFCGQVHRGTVKSPEGQVFKRVILVGIGGSALGPMLLADCFAGASAPMTLRVFDNTDPAGIDRHLEEHGSLADTLILVISKSGGTPETRNGMLELQHACEGEGLAFAGRAVAVTGESSDLDQRALNEGWLRSFPMWDWVGGRTSIFSAVGLLPAGLIGLDLRALLAGAAAMDACTRQRELAHNPAAMMAAFWHKEGRGKGERHAVVLPYKDSLLLFSRYLQQLVMESLGKRLDRQGREVFQGLTVLGNKGSTDQHAYVQQLRDGLHDFFVIFVRVLEGRRGGGVEVEPGITSADYLNGFYLGTRRALSEGGRQSVTINLQRVDERSFGALIALFERAVGLYAELIDVNAYHQPGVEAGKRAAKAALELQRGAWTGLGDPAASGGKSR
ncbi:MAG: glucose-6-phosphate isomerase [Planctomycetota bacterium]|jgi:glucose-6-phosphate isomerase